MLIDMSMNYVQYLIKKRNNIS